MSPTDKMNREQSFFYQYLLNDYYMGTVLKCSLSSRRILKKTIINLGITLQTYGFNHHSEHLFYSTRTQKNGLK